MHEMLIIFWLYDHLLIVRVLFTIKYRIKVLLQLLVFNRFWSYVIRNSNNRVASDWWLHIRIFVTFIIMETKNCTAITWSIDGQNFENNNCSRSWSYVWLRLKAWKWVIVFCTIRWKVYEFILQSWQMLHLIFLY